MSVHTIAPDDIVRNYAEGEANEREPLVVLDPLIDFLDAHRIGSGEPEILPIGEGHSNVTYIVRRGDAEFVLRRPPRGPLAPSTHDVMREARVIQALQGKARVPRVLAVGDDPALIGAPFFAMEFVPGHVITSSVPAELDSIDDRRRLGEDLVDSLAEMHAVDWQAAGLDGFGKPTGYLERQVKRFGELWQRDKTRELPAVERLGDWLKANMPASAATTVVHGDYRLGNLIYAQDSPARAVAILDWEMSTLGDPFADLGYLCALWTDRNDPPLGVLELAAVTREEGFLLREELIARYEDKSGRSVGNIRWYQAMAIWKLMVFMEGNYKRALAGSTDDPFLKTFGEAIADVAGHAEGLING